MNVLALNVQFSFRPLSTEGAFTFMEREGKAAVGAGPLLI